MAFTQDDCLRVSKSARQRHGSAFTAVGHSTCFWLYATLRVLLAIDSEVKSSAHTDKKKVGSILPFAVQQMLRYLNINQLTGFADDVHALEL